SAGQVRACPLTPSAAGDAGAVAVGWGVVFPDAGHFRFARWAATVLHVVVLHVETVALDEQGLALRAIGVFAVAHAAGQIAGVYEVKARFFSDVVGAD